MSENKNNKKQGLIIAILLLIILALVITFAYVLIQNNSVNNQNINENENNLGGFVEAKDGTITDELLEIFNKGVEGITDHIYVPEKLVATQVVSGINYKFLASGTSTSNPITKGKYYITIYKDLNGNISLLDIEVIEEKIDDTISSDVSQMYFSVVFYDQNGNVLQKESLKYGTIPSFKGALPSGFDRWVYMNSNITVKSFEAITGNISFQAVCWGNVNPTPNPNPAPTPSPTPTPTPTPTPDTKSVATVSYVDAHGNKKSIEIKSGTTISFNAGEGFYNTDPKSIKLSKDQKVDLTNSKYIPRALLGKSFVGFDYNSKNKVFTAKYMKALPNKGDVITLNDGKEYKVIDRDGSKVKVVACSYTSRGIAYYGYPNYVTTSEYGFDALKYSGTDIDVHLSQWYLELDDSQGEGKKKPMHDAIILQEDLEQNAYEKVLAEPNDYALKIIPESSDPYYLIEKGSSASIGERYVTSLSINDIVNYFGNKDINANSLLSEFNILAGDNVWLTSVQDTSEAVDTTAYILNQTDTIGVSDYNVGRDSRASFIINLAYDGVEYEIKDYVAVPEKGDLIALNDNKLYRVLSVEGSKALVVSMSYPAYSSFNSGANTTDDFGLTGQKYKDSDLYKAFNTWYESLNDGNTKPMHEAIVEVPSLKQHMYEWHNGTTTEDCVAKGSYILSGRSYDYYITGGYATSDVGSVHVFPLDLKDVVDYLDPTNKTIVPSEIKEMLFNSTTSYSDIWLSSASANGENYAFSVSGNQGKFSNSNPSTQFEVRPAFYIDFKTEGLVFDVKYTNKPVVKYVDENGELQTIRFNAYDTISFDIGDSTIGEFVPSKPSSIILYRYNLIDLTQDRYIPKVQKGYKFIGYKFDEVHHVFVAQYEDCHVTKGDIITLNDGNEYRVLKVDGDKAFVLGMDDLYLGSCFRDSNPTIDFFDAGYGEGNKTGIAYSGSITDNNLGMTWIESLNDGGILQPMYDAIENHSISHNIYHCVSQIPEGKSDYVVLGRTDNYVLGGYSPAVPLTRKAFALDVSEIVEYLGDNEYSQENINKMFFDSSESCDVKIWLRSASFDNQDNVCYVNGSDGSISTQAYSSTTNTAVRPAFWIDLFYTGVNYEIKK